MRRICPLSYDTDNVSAALDSFLSISNTWRLKQVKVHLCLMSCVT